MEIVGEEKRLLNKVNEMLKQDLEENGQNLHLNFTTVERVVISKETVKRHGKGQQPSHYILYLYSYMHIFS